MDKIDETMHRFGNRGLDEFDSEEEDKLPPPPRSLSLDTDADVADADAEHTKLIIQMNVALAECENLRELLRGEEEMREILKLEVRAW